MKLCTCVHLFISTPMDQDPGRNRPKSSSSFGKSGSIFARLQGASPRHSGKSKGFDLVVLRALDRCPRLGSDFDGARPPQGRRHHVECVYSSWGWLGWGATARLFSQPNFGFGQIQNQARHMAPIFSQAFLRFWVQGGEGGLANVGGGGGVTCPILSLSQSEVRSSLAKSFRRAAFRRQPIRVSSAAATK